MYLNQRLCPDYVVCRLLFELSLPDTKNKTEKRYLDLRQRSLRIKSKRKEIEVGVCFCLC